VLGVLSYGIVAYAYANTGEWMLNLLYYLPTNIIAWIAWYKKSPDRVNVLSKAMTAKQILATVVVAIVGIAAYAWLLSLPALQMFFYHQLTGFSYGKYLIDSFNVIGSIVGMILLIRQYREQWLVWIAVDIMTIILWCFTFDSTMILMWATMLANATYGYIKWLKVGGEQNNV
jgi:nicotinamide mononucleotide transporter